MRGQMESKTKKKVIIIEMKQKVLNITIFFILFRIPLPSHL